MSFDIAQKIINNLRDINHMQELQAIEALEYIEANLVLPRRVILSHIAVGINSNIEEEKTKWKLITLYQVTKSLLGKG